MSKIEINKKDILWSYIGNFLKLSINIILLPLVLRFLSEKELGLWYVFSSIGQFIILLDFGFAASLSRNISYVWCGSVKLYKDNLEILSVHETDYRYLKAVLQTCKLIYLSISVVALVILLSVGTVYISELDGENITYISWIIYSFAVFLNLLYSYYTSFLRGVGAIAENNIANVISKIIQIIITCLLLMLDYGLLGISISYLITGIVQRITSRILFSRYENIGEKLSMIEASSIKDCFLLFKTIWHNASRDGLVTISNYLSTHANTLICSSILGLTVTGTYGLAVQISSIIATISTIPFTTIHPKLQEYAVKFQKQKSCSAFSSSIILYIFVFFILTILLYLVLPILYMLRPGLYIDNYFLFGMLIHMFIYNKYRLFASFISTFNVIPYCSAFVTSSLVSVLLSYLLLKYSGIGIWVLVISPIIIDVSYNMWKWTKYTYEKLDCSRADFYRNGIMRIKAMVVDKLSRC